MKHFLSRLKVVVALMVLVAFGGCDQEEDDILPRSFQEFSLYPDQIYIFNDNGSWITRLDPLANDSIKTEVNVTYDQPQKGQLVPDYDGPGTMGYKPNINFYGVDSLNYTVCNAELCKTEKIKLIVEESFDQASCVTMLRADSLETTKNTFKGIWIFENDIICYNDDYGGTYIEKPIKGTFKTINYSGSYKNTIYVYYPPKDFVGEDSFRYRVYTSRDRSVYQEIIVKVTIK